MTNGFIARAKELGRVEAFLDRAGARPRAMVLDGEAGIGKSTLWLAGVAAARERSYRVLASRPAETEQSLPNVVLGDLFGAIEPEVLATLPSPRRHAFESALLLREAPDVPVDPRALGVAILTLLTVLAGDGPLVLAIDDDQWLDASSAATLHFALRRLGTLPIRLLLSRRTGADPPTALEGAIDLAEVERVGVGPLGLPEIQELLRRTLGASFPRPTLARIHEISEGNPLYALELARVHAEGSTRDVTTPLTVPSSLDRLIGARLNALDAPTRNGLLMVAAHGRLPVSLAQAMDLGAEALARARAANVIETAAGVVRFTHPLLASAVYRGASVAERRSAHRRLATLMDDPVHRGRHLALSADEIDEDLASALEAAANVARDRGSSIAAAELAEHALRLTPPDATEDRHRRAIAAARAHLAAGEGARARAIADDLLAAEPSGRRRAEALVLRSEFERPDVALVLREEALAESRSALVLRAAIHAGLAESGWFGTTKEFAWSDRHAQAALRLAERLDDDELRADALAILALLRFSHGEPHALEMAQRAYALAAPLPDPRHVARAVMSLGLVLAWSAPAEEARAWLEGRLATWADRDERVRYEIVGYLALMEFRAGRWAIATDYADEVLEITNQYGFLGPYDLLVPALVALHRGELEVARETARRALALGEGLQLEFFLAIVAICDLWTGNAGAALVNFILAERAADENGEEEPTMRFWRAEYVEALLQLGRADEAARLTTDWEAAARRLGRTRVVAQAAHCRGLIAAARGDMPAAVAALGDAVHLLEDAGDPFGRSRALLALGVALRRSRQKRTSREAIDAAIAGFVELGAEGWTATAREELARIGGRQRQEGLSPSELGVATLVAEGRTNREIAAALFMGERTVGGHLTRIYSKLGIRSRTELARTLHAAGKDSAGPAGKVERS